jgi:hypothetical protein
LRFKPVLKFLHAFGDERFGNAKMARGGDKTPALDDANKHANPGQLVHDNCARFENDQFLYWPIIIFFSLI